MNSSPVLLLLLLLLYSCAAAAPAAGDVQQYGLGVMRLARLNRGGEKLDIMAILDMCWVLAGVCVRLLFCSGRNSSSRVLEYARKLLAASTCCPAATLGVLSCCPAILLLCRRFMLISRTQVE